jgi:hypothetical protein
VTFSLTNTPAQTGPAHLTVVSGSGQSAQVSTEFAAPLVAKVTDSAGNGVAGVYVTFSAPPAGASAKFGFVNGVTVQTDSSGLATSPTPVANAVAGSYAVRATSGSLTPVAFSLTNTPAQTGPAHLTVVSGSGQSAQAGMAFPAPLVAKVTDAAGNGVSGISVTFASPASGASASFGGASSSTVQTNANGLATSPTPVANAVAGSYTVTATSGSLTPVTFSLTNTPAQTGPAHLTVVSGSGQSAQVGTEFAAPLVAKVTDASGNGVAGVYVTFSAPPVGASAKFGFVNGVTVQTDSSGLATSPTPIANAVAGSYHVTATSESLGPVTFALTNRL